MSASGKARWLAVAVCALGCETFDGQTSVPPSADFLGDQPLPPQTLDPVLPGPLHSGSGFDAMSPPTANEPLSGIEAGLEPSRVDSDQDGCPDLAEDLLGGCDGDKDVILWARCFQSADADDVTFDVPSKDAGAFPGASLVVSSAAGRVAVVATDVLPAGAAVFRNESFGDVQGGSRLTFHLEYVGPWERKLSLTSLFLITDTGEVLDQGRLLLLSDGPCPLTP